MAAPAPRVRPMARLRRLLLRLAALLVLLLVYASYLQPAFVVELGNRFWSCF